MEEALVGIFSKVRFQLYFPPELDVDGGDVDEAEVCDLEDVLVEVGEVDDEVQLGAVPQQEVRHAGARRGRLEALLPHAAADHLAHGLLTDRRVVESLARAFQLSGTRYDVTVNYFR